MAQTKHGIPQLKPKASQYYVKTKWATPPPSPKSNLSLELLAKFRRQRQRCWYCGLKMRPAWITVDHVNPRCLGGTDDMSNIVCACYSCNNLKADLLPSECYAKFYHVRHPTWGGLYWGEVCQKMRIESKQYENFKDNQKSD